MKIDYRILVIDDKPKDILLKLKEIEKITRENFFIPKIDLAIQQFKKPPFMNIFDDNTKVKDVLFNDYDLILMDLYLATKQEDKDKKSGEKLIKKLRDAGIYTDTVFYSGAMGEYRKRKNKLELDNVTYADKTELVSKTEILIRKRVTQSINISELRGYLMDSTSEFDYICKDVALYYFDKLNSKNKNLIINDIEKYIHQQYENEQEKFQKINNIYRRADLSKIPAFKDSLIGSNLIEKLQQALDSQEAVIITKNKFRILAEILRKNGIKNADDIYLFDGTNHIEKYDKEIIKPRNIFGHSKLSYGEKCGKKIIVVKHGQVSQCNCKLGDCSDCSQSTTFDYEQCVDLRKSIYKYHELFNQTLKQMIS